MLRGARDSFVSPEWMETLTAQFPNGRSATIARAAHAAHYMQPEEVARVALRFLLERSARAPRLQPSRIEERV